MIGSTHAEICWLTTLKELRHRRTNTYRLADPRLPARQCTSSHLPLWRMSQTWGRTASPENADSSMETLMRRIVSCWLTAVLGTATCSYGVLRTPTIHAESRIQPFYLEQTISMLHSTDGALRAAKHAIVARRSDGTGVRSESVGPLSDGLYVRTVSWPDGRHVTLYDNLRLRTTWPLRRDSDDALQRHLAPVPPHCVDSAPSAFVSFEEIQSVAVAVSRTIRDENIVTVWRAPSLACEELSYRNEKRQQDGTFSVVYETTTTKLTLGESDQALFIINEDYVESKPSDALNALVRAMSVVASSEELRLIRNQGRREDAVYQSQPPSRP
jgi:hypothetical protein